MRHFLDVNMLMCHLNIYRFQSHRIFGCLRCAFETQRTYKYKSRRFSLRNVFKRSERRQIFCQEFEKVSLKDFDGFFSLSDGVLYILING